MSAPANDPSANPTHSATTDDTATSTSEQQPQFESDAARQSFNAAVMSALTAQRTSALAAQADTAAHGLAPVGSVEAHIHPDTRTNLHTVRCRFCNDKVLTPGSATFEQRPHDLHLLGGAKDDPARETLNEWWYVAGQMQFENVGVTRNADPTFRYLTCSACDRGPIGINFLNEPTKFYVAHARVKYDA